MKWVVKDRRMLCLDWGERSLRMLEINLGRNSSRVLRAVHVPLGQDWAARNPAAMGEFIRRTLGEHRIRARRAMVSVPRQDVLLNLLSLPRGSMDELAAMVHIQIGKELPFSKDQAVIDFAVSRQDESNTVDVWVAAVRNEVVDHYRQVLRAAGLTLERIGLRPYANLTAVTGGRAVAGQLLLVDVGTTMTEIDVIRDGRLVFSRAASAPMPPEGLKGLGQEDRRQVMETLLVEVSRTIQAYRAMDPGWTIGNIVLTGTGGVDDELAAAFRERFSSPAAVFDLPDNLRWTERVAPTPFCATVGLALGNTGEYAQRFDFLHPKEPEAEQRAKAKKRPMIAAAVAVCLIMLGVLAYQPFRTRHQKIEEIKAEIARLNQDKKEREELMEQLADARAWQERSVAWIDQLKRLGDVFPKDSNKNLYITKVDGNERGQITIELVATNKLVSTNLVDAIKEIKDENGQAVFNAVVGNTEPNPRDPKYPIKDKINLTIRSLASTGGR